MNNLFVVSGIIILVFVVSFMHIKLWHYIRSHIKLSSDLPKDDKLVTMRTIFMLVGMYVGIIFWEKITEIFQYDFNLNSLWLLMSIGFGGVIFLSVLESVVALNELKK